MYYVIRVGNSVDYFLEILRGVTLFHDMNLVEGSWDAI